MISLGALVLRHGGLIKQMGQYCLVGLLGLFLHLRIIAGWVELAGFYYSLAFISALPLTYGSKFVLDKCWTFR